MSLCGLCSAALFPAGLSGQGDPTSMPPREGDVLVKLGDKTLTPLTPADVPAGSRMVSAWPMAPADKVVRNGSRLNEVLLVRLPPSELGASQLHATEGVLAYSALCPHAGCNVSAWAPETGTLSCDCHGSEFDARAVGQVTVGPATRALPVLGLKLDGGVLAVAKPFAGPIRFEDTGRE